MTRTRQRSAIIFGFVLVAASIGAESAGCSSTPSTTTSTCTVDGGCPTQVTCVDSGPACDTAEGCATGVATACVLAECSHGCCTVSNASKGSPCTDNEGTVCDGAGHCIGCNVDTDCATTGTDCAVPSCNTATHKCEVTDAPMGTSCSNASGMVCDGSGYCVGCDVNSDCPATGTACAAASCNVASQVCELVEAPMGTACTDNGGTVCDGAGHCVGCNTGGDCASSGSGCSVAICSPTSHTCTDVSAPMGTACMGDGGTVCNGSGMCVQGSCSDGVKGAGETDVDCGGSVCPACGDGRMCEKGSDCRNKVCVLASNDANAEGVCAPPSCTDGVENGDETGVDCGGAAYMEPADAGVDAGPFSACPPCAAGMGCHVASDCQSGNCAPDTIDAGPLEICVGLALGATCTSGMQCNSGACVPDDTNTSTDVCCDTGCTAGSMASCGDDGNCKHDGSACAQYSATTQCQAESCNAATSMLTPAGTCNGTGACTASGSPAPCAHGLICASTSTCASSCTAGTAAGCAAPTTTMCNAGGTACLLDPGQSCTTGSQCLNGSCASVGAGGPVCN
jgi:hypothetical protein